MKARYSLIFYFILFQVVLNAQSYDFKRSNSVYLFDLDSNKLNNPWAGGLNSAQFSTINLNDDAFEDLFVFDRQGNKILTFINDGIPNQASYTYAPQYESAFPEIANWVLLRDFNGDGKKDIFSYRNGGIRIYKNISTVGNLEFEVFDNFLLSLQYSTQSNLYVSSVDLPSISDIDGDGDLDILTFGILGAAVEYHKNLSFENYGTLDSLDYIMKNTCWGNFSETGSFSNKLKLYDTCSWNVGGPQRHSGSTVLVFDIDSNGAADIMLGDVSFDNLVVGFNGGTIPNANTSLTSQDTIFPYYDVPLSLHTFPAAFYEDVNNDGKKDLIVSPNTPDQTENVNSVWLYQNTRNTQKPIFTFQKENFLQDEMLDLGRNAVPVIFDREGDGLMDLVVSYSVYNPVSLANESKLAFVQNFGTPTLPKFRIVDLDYQSISAHDTIGQYFYPAFADLDNDGDKDMLIGTDNGKIHYFKNNPVSGLASFSLFQANIKNNLNQIIDVGNFAAPQLFDYDGDGDYDLIVGKRKGTLVYFENTGSVSAPIFTHITDSMGGVYVNESWDINGISTGFSTPNFIHDGSNIFCFVGAKDGHVKIYNNVNPSSPTSWFTESDSSIFGGVSGGNSAMAIFDFNQNGKLDAFVGTDRGGLTFYSDSSFTTEIIEQIEQVQIQLYPNPTEGEITLKLNLIGNQTKYIITDISGKIIKMNSLQNKLTRINLGGVSQGIYNISIFENNNHIKTKSFVIQ